jgi:hypothetical protein
MSEIRDDYKKTYISTATTTQVFSGAGRLHSIVLGTALDAAGDISIIDNTTGTTVNVGFFNDTATTEIYTFNCHINTGLRIITAGADKITVVYSTNA